MLTWSRMSLHMHITWWICRRNGITLWHQGYVHQFLYLHAVIPLPATAALSADLHTGGFQPCPGRHRFQGSFFSLHNVKVPLIATVCWLLIQLLAAHGCHNSLHQKSFFYAQDSCMKLPMVFTPADFAITVVLLRWLILASYSFSGISNAFEIQGGANICNAF